MRCPWCERTVPTECTQCHKPLVEQPCCAGFMGLDLGRDGQLWHTDCFDDANRLAEEQEAAFSQTERHKEE